MITLLENPGLVENDKDNTSCFLACTQMVMRAKRGAGVLSFDDLSKIIRRRPGEYSWEYAILAYLANNGFDVHFISSFDLNRFVSDTETYMYQYFGTEAAEDQISHSNMINAVEDAQIFMHAARVTLQTRVPNLQDIRQLLRDGYYLVPYVNQRVLQADEGYVAHTVLAYGFSDRGVRIHNPGPPPVEGAELSWDLFTKAWSSPSEQARILMAFRPNN